MLNKSNFLITLSCLTFLLFAAASKSVKITTVPSSLPTRNVDTKPLYDSNKVMAMFGKSFEDLIFCVLPPNLNSYDNQALNGEIQETISLVVKELSNNGVKVVDWQNAKQIYQEQVLNGKTQKTAVDYYIYIEKCDSKYYYHLINARNYRVDFARELGKISYEGLMIPFIGLHYKIPLEFIQYCSTTNDTEYNTLLSGSDVSAILKSSKSKFDEGIAKKFDQNSKKKDKESYYNDQYAVAINLATCYLLSKEFNKMNDVLSDLDRIQRQCSGGLELQTQYIDQLQKTCRLWNKAQDDSLRAALPESNIAKKSINISQNQDGQNGNGRYDSFEDEYRLRWAYSNAVISLFNWRGDKIDIYERFLVDKILSVNSEVFKKAEGKTDGADYLLSIRKNSWGLKDVKVRKREKNPQTGLEEEVEVIERVKKIDLTLKITNNSDGIILGTIDLVFDDAVDKVGNNVIADSDRLRTMFSSKNKVKDFYIKRIN